MPGNYFAVFAVGFGCGWLVCSRAYIWVLRRTKSEGRLSLTHEQPEAVTEPAPTQPQPTVTLTHCKICGGVASGLDAVDMPGGGVAHTACYFARAWSAVSER